MSRLLDHIITERKGHYVHALELDSAYSYENVIEQIVNDYKGDFTKDEILDFVMSMDIYYYNGDEPECEYNEEQLYNFDVAKFINECY